MILANYTSIWYNFNAKTTNGVETKYVYGLGLIGEEKCDEFKTYHFDYRGSTIAITDSYGYVIDTFEYDLYGNVTNHNGYSFVIFGYNGRDGVVTDNNGLIYMRARYYSPELKRFINADILAGEISDAITLNRYAYANGNPVSLVDPFGLAADDSRGGPSALEAAYMSAQVYKIFQAYCDDIQISEDAYAVGAWKFINDSFVANKKGLFIGVYKRQNSDGTVSYAVVNKGTDTTNGWLNNVLQPFGFSNDMRDSINFAKQFVDSNPNANITFIGHSKGGGEALANAKATNRNAIVFNPAIPNYNIYGLGTEAYTALATSYVTVGEALSDGYILGESIAADPSIPLTPWLNDDFFAIATRFVFNSPPFWVTLPLAPQSLNPITNHGIESVITALGGEVPQ